MGSSEEEYVDIVADAVGYGGEKPVWELSDSEDGMGGGDASEYAAKYGLPPPASPTSPSLPSESPPKATRAALNEDVPDVDWEGGGFEQMNELAEENQGLLARLDTKQAEIDRLEEMLIAVEPIPGLDAERLLDVVTETGEMIDKDPRDVKIMQLAKRVRTINVKLQRERDLAKAAQAEAEKYKEIADGKVYPQKLRSARASPAKGGKGETKGEEREPESETVARAEAQVKAMSSKVEGMRIKLTRAQADVKAAKRALQAELGDVPLDVAMDEDSGWRGRAQKIVMLKSKVKRLEKQIAEGAVGDAAGPRRPGGGGGAGGGAPRPGRSIRGLDVDTRADETIASKRRERVKAEEALREELESTKIHATEMKKRFEAQRARNKVLENDTKRAKAGVKALLNKASNDDKLVQALRAELDKFRTRSIAGSTVAGSTVAGSMRTMSIKGPGSIRSGATMRTEDTDATVAEFVSENERLSRNLADQQRRLEHQEQVIATLRQQVSSMKTPMGRPSSADVRRMAEAEMTGKTTKEHLRLAKMSLSKQQEIEKSLRKQVANLQGEQEDWIARVTKLEGRLAELEGDDVGPDSPRTLEGRLAAVERERNAIKSSFRSAIKSKDEDIARLKEQVRQITSDAEDAKGRPYSPIDVAKGDMEQLKQDNELMMREIQSLRRQLRSATGK